MLANIIYNHVSPYGDDFCVLKLDVLLLLRNTLITRLSSEESTFVLVEERNSLYTE